MGSLEYMSLKENKSLLWALQERGRETRTTYISGSVSLDLFNAFWVITAFTRIDGLFHKCSVLGKFVGSCVIGLDPFWTDRLEKHK